MTEPLAPGTCAVFVDEGFLLMDVGTPELWLHNLYVFKEPDPNPSGAGLCCCPSSLSLAAQLYDWRAEQGNVDRVGGFSIRNIFVLDVNETGRERLMGVIPGQELQGC